MGKIIFSFLNSKAIRTWALRRRDGIRLKVWAVASNKPGFEPRLYHLLMESFWASVWNSLFLHFPVCREGNNSSYHKSMWIKLGDIGRALSSVLVHGKQYYNSIYFRLCSLSANYKGICRMLFIISIPIKPAWTKYFKWFFLEKMQVPVDTFHSVAFLYFLWSIDYSFPDILYLFDAHETALSLLFSGNPI